MNYSRVKEIAQELSYIETAIEQASIGYGNTKLGGKAELYDSNLFAELSGRRELLRRELVEMG